MGAVRYVWAVEPARSAEWQAQGRWVQHALRSSKPFTEASAALMWRRARSDALCGAHPPDGVWSSIGNGWVPAERRRVVTSLGQQGYVGLDAPAVVCPDCERLAAGLDPARERW